MARIGAMEALATHYARLLGPDDSWRVEAVDRCLGRERRSVRPSPAVTVTGFEMNRSALLAVAALHQPTAAFFGTGQRRILTLRLQYTR